MAAAGTVLDAGGGTDGTGAAGLAAARDGVAGAGAVAAAGVLYMIASGSADFELSGGFASNGYGDHSPDRSGPNKNVLVTTSPSALNRVRIPSPLDKWPW